MQDAEEAEKAGEEEEVAPADSLQQALEEALEEVSNSEPPTDVEEEAANDMKLFDYQQTGCAGLGGAFWTGWCMGGMGLMRWCLGCMGFTRWCMGCMWLCVVVHFM
jgi:hypothetical protein